MYVCLCNGITDRDIRRCCAEGEICTLRDLEACLGVGANCGRCRQAAQELLDEARREPVALAA